MSYQYSLTFLGLLLIAVGLFERGWLLLAVWFGCEFLVLGIAHACGIHQILGKRPDGLLTTWSRLIFLQGSVLGNWYSIYAFSLRRRRWSRASTGFVPISECLRPAFPVVRARHRLKAPAPAAEPARFETTARQRRLDTIAVIPSVMLRRSSRAGSRAYAASSAAVKWDFQFSLRPFRARHFLGGLPQGGVTALLAQGWYLSPLWGWSWSVPDRLGEDGEWTVEDRVPDSDFRLVSIRVNSWLKSFCPKPQ
jgi:hypothetical protein